MGYQLRPNSGTVVMELLRQDNGDRLMTGTFDASVITEGQILTISSEEPIETVYEVPLVLRLSADSPAGSAVTPWIVSQSETDGFEL